LIYLHDSFAANIVLEKKAGVSYRQGCHVPTPRQGTRTTFNAIAVPAKCDAAEPKVP
jgi:hypothetical protein